MSPKVEISRLSGVLAALPTTEAEDEQLLQSVPLIPPEAPGIAHSCSYIGLTSHVLDKKTKWLAVAAGASLTRWQLLWHGAEGSGRLDIGEEAILHFRILRKRALRQMLVRLRQQLHTAAPKEHVEL